MSTLKVGQLQDLLIGVMKCQCCGQLWPVTVNAGRNVQTPGGWDCPRGCTKKELIRLNKEDRDRRKVGLPPADRIKFRIERVR